MKFTKLAIGADGSILLEGEFSEQVVRDILASWHSGQPDALKPQIQAMAARLKTSTQDVQSAIDADAASTSAT